MAGKSQPAVSASAPKYSKGGGKLESINIEPTDNGGFIVSESRRGPQKKGNDYPSYSPPSRNAFGGADEALAYVKQCLGSKE